MRRHPRLSRTARRPRRSASARLRRLRPGANAATPENCSRASSRAT